MGSPRLRDCEKWMRGCEVVSVINYFVSGTSVIF